MLIMIFIIVPICFLINLLAPKKLTKKKKKTNPED